MAYDIQLSLPLVNQLAKVTTDSRPDENALYNCGPSTDGGIVQYTTGVTFLPDEVHDIIWNFDGKKPETAGVTNEKDLRRFLKERAGINSTLIEATSRGESMAAIRSYIFQGLPLIVLRSFTAPGSSDGHWCTVIGAAGADSSHTSTVYTNNPWGGYLMTETNDVFWSWQYNNYPTPGVSLLIGIDTPRNPWLP